ISSFRQTTSLSSSLAATTPCWKRPKRPQLSAARLPWTSFSTQGKRPARNARSSRPTPKRTDALIAPCQPRARLRNEGSKIRRGIQPPLSCLRQKVGNGLIEYLGVGQIHAVRSQRDGHAQGLRDGLFQDVQAAAVASRAVRAAYQQYGTLQ